jgi:hypothetical protein
MGAIIADTTQSLAQVVRNGGKRTAHLQGQVLVVLGDPGHQRLDTGDEL